MEREILDHLATNHLGGERDGLDENTPLLELNILDSVEILGLVQFLQRRFGVVIPAHEIVPQNFKSVRQMGTLLRALHGEEERV